jgi:deoxynucleoside kinase
MVYSIYIEGNIASGKSTLLRGLQVIQEATCFFEPVEDWRYASFREHTPNLLKDFYLDPKTNARAFQEAVLETYAEMHSVDVSTTFKIQERSIHSSSIFRSVLVEEHYLTAVQDEELGSIYRATCASVPSTPDLVLYLWSDPMLCLQLMQERGRTEEREVGLPYLTKLHYAHEHWIKTCPYPVLTLENSAGADAVKRSAIAAIFRTFAENKIRDYLALEENAVAQN